MQKMTNEDMLKIEGGTTLTASFLNAITRTGELILDLGRSLGSAIRRIYEKNSCPLD